MTRHRLSPNPKPAGGADRPSRAHRNDRSFVTDGRICMATRYADELAARKPWLTAPECSGEAVRQIFGRWILDHTAAIRPKYIPLYFQLIAAVENRLGLHRRAAHDGEPVLPVMAAAARLPATGNVPATSA